MNIWLILIPIVVLISGGIAAFIIFRKKSSSKPTTNPTLDIKLSINVGKIQPKV